MMYYALTPPTQWQAGRVAPDTPNEKTFYFDCGANEPEIAGILSSDGSFSGMAILKVEGSSFFNPAMFCAPCFQRRLNAGVEKRFHVVFDGEGDYTLADLYDDVEEGSELITREEAEAMTVGQTTLFGGGAMPLGSITRLQ